MDKKLILPHFEWCIGKCPGLCTIFFKTFTRYLKFMLYHAVICVVWDTLYFRFFLSIVLPLLCSEGFKPNTYPVPISLLDIEDNSKFTLLGLNVTSDVI